MNEQRDAAFEKWRTEFLQDKVKPMYWTDLWNVAWQAGQQAQKERDARVVEGWHIVGAEDSPITAPHNLWIERVAAAIRNQESV